MRWKLRPELAADAQQKACCVGWSQVKSSQYTWHPSQGNSTNYYLSLGSPSRLRLSTVNTSQQIPKLLSKRVKNLATPFHFYFCFFSIYRRALLPIRRSSNRANVQNTVERRFLDPEYSLDEYFQLGSRRKVGPIKNQLASPDTSN